MPTDTQVGLMDLSPKANSNGASRQGAAEGKAPVIARSTNRLAAIANGEPFEAVIHDAVLNEEPVLEINNFNLWYGDKQALYDISMTVPKGE